MGLGPSCKTLDQKRNAKTQAWTVGAPSLGGHERPAPRRALNVLETKADVKDLGVGRSSGVLSSNSLDSRWGPCTASHGFLVTGGESKSCHLPPEE